MKSIEMLNIVQAIGLVLYFFVAAQGAFYRVGFGKALFDISPESFIELRKAVDPRVRRPLRALYISSLATTLTWLVLTVSAGGLLTYGPVLVAFLLLVADLALALKRSEPVNVLINADLLNTHQGYVNARDEWMKFIFLRGSLVVAGFVVLMLYVCL
ncbi:hypothetical protein [Dyadobacter sp. 22481]|uniref:hypothetical protein n=1 Tax=Dyadobacter sp. 22481 TaxID=3453926 RepID=UPI003F839C71